MGSKRNGASAIMRDEIFASERKYPVMDMVGALASALEWSREDGFLRYFLKARKNDTYPELATMAKELEGLKVGRLHKFSASYNDDPESKSPYQTSWSVFVTNKCDWIWVTTMRGPGVYEYKARWLMHHDLPVGNRAKQFLACQGHNKQMQISIGTDLLEALVMEYNTWLKPQILSVENNLEHHNQFASWANNARRIEENGNIGREI